jgi:hypothetical protein
MKERPMKHNRRRRSPGKPRGSPTVLDRINPNVAGIDCGSAEHLVAVPPDRDPTPVQSFQTFTSDLRRLADWLAACRVTSVAMEATGVYWIPIYEILEAQGFEVLLVNARHLKTCPDARVTCPIASGSVSSIVWGSCAGVFGLPPPSSLCAPTSAIGRP